MARWTGGALLAYALRGIARRRSRSLATVLGIAAGVAATLASAGLGRNLEVSLQTSFQEAAGPVTLTVAPGAGRQAVFLAQPVLEVLAGEAAIIAALPVLEQPAAILDLPQAVPGSLTIEADFILLTGMPLDAPEGVILLERGRLPVEGAAEILVGDGFLDRAGLAIGQVARIRTLVGARDFQITGTISEHRGAASLTAGRIALTSLERARQDLALPGRASRIDLLTLPAERLPPLRDRLQAKLGPGVTVLFPAQRGELVAGAIENVQVGVRILTLTVLLVAVFLAYNTFAGSALERAREHALLRALGASRRTLFRVAALEALAIGALGTLAGIGLGLALADTLIRINAAIIGLTVTTVTVTLPELLLAVAVGLGCTLAAAWSPAKQAASVPPLVVTRKADSSAWAPEWQGALALVAGLGSALAPWPPEIAFPMTGATMAFLFTGAILFAPHLIRRMARVCEPFTRRLPPAFRLGLRNATLTPSRNAIAAGAVTIGVALVLGVSAMVGGFNSDIRRWVESTLGGDLVVSSAARFDQAALASFRQIQGVRAASPVALRSVRVEPPGAPARPVTLIVVEPKRFRPGVGFAALTFLRGDPDRGLDALERGGAVLVSTAMEHRFGLRVGDSLPIRTATGFEEFEVAGVILDFTSGGDSVITGLADAPRFGVAAFDAVFFDLAEGADRAVAKAAIRATDGGEALTIQTDDQYRALVGGIAERTFWSTNALLALAVIIAVLGVANTLGMNALERAREIGMLRAIGARRSQVIAMIATEGALITTTGALIGLVSGLAMGPAIVRATSSLTGFETSASISLELILATALGGPLIGVLAAIYPARRAASLPPAVALSNQ